MGSGRENAWLWSPAQESSLLPWPRPPGCTDISSPNTLPGPCESGETESFPSEGAWPTSQTWLWNTEATCFCLCTVALLPPTGGTWETCWLCAFPSSVRTGGSAAHSAYISRPTCHRLWTTFPVGTILRPWGCMEDTPLVQQPQPASKLCALHGGAPARAVECTVSRWSHLVPDWDTERWEMRGATTIRLEPGSCKEAGQACVVLKQRSRTQVQGQEELCLSSSYTQR